MTHQPSPIAVIGSGVIGLTSAIRLLEQGFPVTIFAQATPPHTTSDVAAAYWAPSPALAGGWMKTWALNGLAALQALASDPANGVFLTNLYELTDTPHDFSALRLPMSVENVALGIFPKPWSGFRINVPRIDVPLYMPRLLNRFLAAGGTVKQATLTAFTELAGEYRIIVNCAGLGAQALTGDEMYPIRGQVMRVRKPEGIAPDMIYAETEETVTYIIPRVGDCLLGGTYHFGNGSMQIDQKIAEGILQRCAVFNPAFKNPEIFEHRVGLRPGRQQVRLETEKLSNGAVVIHNYGHSAVGHTLAWGCAAEVVALVQSSDSR